MNTINVSRFFQGVQALPSQENMQPKDTSSFLSKILTISNNVTSLIKSQNSPEGMKIQTKQSGKRQAPPRPAQPALALKLKMAMADFKQDPEMAREKWGVRKGIPDEQTEQKGKRQAPPRPAQPALALKLKMAMADFKQDPEMAREKWGVRKGIPDSGRLFWSSKS